TASCHERFEAGHRPGTARGSAEEGFIGDSLRRDVRRGALVTGRTAYPFDNACGRRSITIQVRFSAGPGETQVLVGRATVQAPPGTRPGPPQSRSATHHAP